MPIRPERARRVAAVLAGVALLHGFAFWLLTRRPPPPRPTSRIAVSLRIVPAPPPPPPVVSPPRPAARSPESAPRTPTAVPRRSERLSHEPDAATPSLPAAPEAREAQAITMVPAAPPASAPEPPLRLELPRRAVAGAPPVNPALADPRSNTPRRSPGEGLAAALGSDPRLVEQARGDGRWRYREGSDCVDVRPARNTGLDPFNQATRPSPKLVEPCP